MASAAESAGAAAIASPRWRRLAPATLTVVNHAIPLLLLGIVWQLVATSGAVDEELFPTCTAVLSRAVELLREGEIVSDLAVTIYRALAGLVIGGVTGVTLGLVMARSSLVRRTAYPLVTLTYTLPKTALIPIALLWLGVGNSSTILVASLATFVPLVISAYHGVEAVPVHYIWSAQAMGTRPVRLTTSVMVPAALPYILNGTRIALAFSVVVVISAEMVAAFSGVGKAIFAFGQSGDYTSMFAAILLVVIVAFALDRLLHAITRRVLSWSEEEAGRV